MIRVELRNEFGLGTPELYKKEAVTGDDPKALLDGVAVSGLVGILRQLGDLAEFAAEVFHGLQEQVTMTSSRSRKLMTRVQHVEAALPSLEKAVLAQKSHLHFAYTAGSYWHPRVHCEKHHFIYSDLPRFVMDSYEECRGPPHLHLLDKFDPGGPGSCLKRYSDPTFFRRTSGGHSAASSEKHPKDKKIRRNKKRRSWRRKEVSRGASSASYSGRMHFGPVNVEGQTSPSQSVSPFDGLAKLDIPDVSIFDQTNGFGNMDCVFQTHPEEQYPKESFSPSGKHHDDSIDYAFLNENGGALCNFHNIQQEPSGKGRFISDDVPNFLPEETGPVQSDVACDKKADKFEPVLQEFYHDEILETFPRKFEVDSVEREDITFETLASEPSDHSRKEESDPDGKLGSRSTNLEEDIIKREAVNLEIVDHRFFQLDNGQVYAYTNDDQVEDIESETDNFMDALNTIESESETDADYQRKREGDQYSNITKEKVHDEMNGTNLQHPDCHASSFDFNAAVRSSCQEMVEYDTSQEEPKTHLVVDCMLDKAMPRSQSNSNALEQPRHVQSSQVDGACLLSESRASSSNLVAESQSLSSQETFEYDTSKGEPKTHLEPDSNLVKATSRSESNSISLEYPTYLQSRQVASHLGVACPPDVGPIASSDVTGGSSAEFQVKSSSSSIYKEHSSVGVSGDKITSSPPESQKPPPQPSFVTSVQFWTNGGLLGLEPSKPPDFSVLNDAGTVSVATTDETANVASYNQHSQDSDAVPKSSQDIPHTSSSNCSTSYQDDEECGFTRWKIARKLPSADLDVRHQQLSGNHFTESPNNGFRNASVTSRDAQAKVKEGDCKSSFGMLEIGNSLLANGFHRKSSVDRNENQNSTSSLGTGIYEQDSQRSITHRTFSGRSNDFSRSRTPILSPSSSPPLGHMKISFQPVDGLETSKLKLKFPNGNNGHESSGDIFPSFQLVPEPPSPLNDINSNSDEDTFCHSSAYTSDDCLSHHSESDSELWESGESPAIKDHELYDALRRISLTESVSTSLGTGGTAQGNIHDHHNLRNSFAQDGVGRSQSAHFFDLPILYTLSPSFKKGLNDNSNCKGLLKSYSLKEPTPPPPPLPPMQWRGTKPDSYMTEERQHFVPEAPDYVLDIKLSESTISQQPKPAPLGQDQIVDAAAYMLKSKELGRSVSMQNETKQAAYGNGKVEKEDFLQQIRKKSFNLRRTVTSKPTAQTGLPSNVQVTAILEKANAIRQAVGSDDGDDDENWSDN